MTGIEYQQLAARTDLPKTDYVLIKNAAYGLCGESGEVIDSLKKYEFQGHILEKEHLVEELGDILWYIAQACRGLHITLDDVMEYNIEKLRKRYPKGFEAEKSIHREV